LPAAGGVAPRSNTPPLTEVTPFVGFRRMADYRGPWASSRPVYDEDACRVYLSRLRWPDGFAAVWRGEGLVDGERTLAMCRVRCQTSVTAGTVFQDTRNTAVVVSRDVWVAGQKTGASALGRNASWAGSYETAWTGCTSCAERCQAGTRSALGPVEVDESFVGGVGGLPAPRTLFFRLAQQAVAVEPPPYRRLVKHVRRHRNR